MAFNQPTMNTNNIQSLDSLPNDNTGLTDTQLKQAFDQFAIDMKAYMISHLAELASIGAAGNIGATAPTGLTGSTIQAILNSIANLGVGAFPGVGTVTDLMLSNVSDQIKARLATHIADNTVHIGNNDACKVYHNAAQSIPNITNTALAFNSELFDNNAMHDTVTNNTRITCKTTGIYNITGNITYLGATGARGLTIRLNGTTDIANIYVPGNGASDNTTLNVSTLYKLNATDYVELMAFQYSGSSLNTQSNSFSPTFSMIKVG